MQRLNMEPENLPQMTIYQELEVLLTGAMRFVESLMMPGWRLYQVLIILALIVIALALPVARPRIVVVRLDIVHGH